MIPESASASSDSPTIGCNTLDQAANLYLYIKNTFRLTGLPVFESEKDIKKRADRQKKLAKYGGEEDKAKIPYPLLTPTTEDQITAAMQRLKNPELRMVDEFFWFLPETIENPENDSSYQAILAGDQDTAFQIWTNKEYSLNGGSIAKHNLAVLFHLTALDWTEYQLGDAHSFIQVEREEKIRGYWTNAIRRWKLVCKDDKIEEYIKERIKAVDDPRLTTGFGRRLFEKLPEALCKINAEIALRFFQAGKTQWATEHVQYMRDIEPSKAILARISANVLGSLAEQVKHQVKAAQQEYRAKPEEGRSLVDKLLKDCLPIKKIYDLFMHEDDHQKTELFDEVVTIGINGIVQYQIQTGDNVSFVRVLKELLPLASQSEIIERINNNIRIGEGNVVGAKHKEIYKLIYDLRDSKTTKAHRKLADFKSIIVKRIADAAERDGALSEPMVELYDACAWALRSISIDAYNNEKATVTALETVNLASLIAKDKDLKTKIKADINTIEETMRRR
jgi:hypothetical protein